MSKWPTRPLEEVATLVGGGTPKRDNVDYWNGDIPWVTPTDLPDADSGVSVIAETKDYITSSGLASSSATLVPEGTVLFSSRATIGKVAVAARTLTTNQGFANFVPSPDVTSRYLAYALWHHRDDIARLSGSTTFKEVSRGNLRGYKIPVPSLDEQERIVRLLDEADAIRKLRTKADQRTADLIPALFHQMFGDPIMNPMGWPLQTLREISQKFSDGPFGSNLKSSHYTETGVRVVRLQNIGVGTFVDRDKAYIAPEHFDLLRRHECRPGDILVGTLGNPNLRACILPETIPVALNKADCIQVRPRQGIAVAEYVAWLLNSPRLVEELSSLALGQTRARISMGRLSLVKVPVPPVDLQLRFQERVRETTELRVSQYGSTLALDSLQSSLTGPLFE